MSHADPLPARDLGVPITSANRISYTVARGFGEQGHDLLCWTTTAESGGHFTAMDLSTGKVYTHALNSLEAYPIVAGSDRNIYVGSTSGEVMRWKPLTDEWGPLGKPVFTKEWPLVRALCEGPDRWLYAGSPTGKRARIHMETGEVQPLPETPEQGYWYVASVAALPDGRIAFGYGHKARLFIYDPRLGKDVGQWLPPGWIEDGFINTLTAGKTVLYAHHSLLRRLGVFDIETGRLLDPVPWPEGALGDPWSKWMHGDWMGFYLLPGTDTLIASDGRALYQYDPRRPDLPETIPWSRFKPPADLALEMRYEVTTDGRVLQYDARRMKVIKSVSTPQPKVERIPYALGVGPDGKVYGGAFQSMLLFRHDPKTGETTVLGDHHPGWSGELYSFTVRKGELICASYINGAIVAYNPSKPWDCEKGRMVNPRLLGFMGQRVYRPVSTCISEDGKIWSVGPAGWGSTGGGVAYIDPAPRKTGSTPLPEAPVDVIPLPGNRLLVCGGGLLRWWDASSNREIAQAALPLPLVSAAPMDARPSARVLMASGNELLVVSVEEPGQVKAIARHASPIPCERALFWEGKAVVGGPKGFAIVDLQTGASVHFCDTPPAFRWAYTIAAGNVYFSKGSHLMTAPIPFVPAKANDKQGISTASKAKGPLRVHPTNPRYFTDGIKGVYLGGHQIFVDVQDNSFNKEFTKDMSRPEDPGSRARLLDWQGYLDFLAKHDFNYIRGWIIWSTGSGKTAPPNRIAHPMPFRRTGPGAAVDGGLKFDLRRFDESFFRRLRDRARDLQKRGVYLSVMLFELYGFLDGEAVEGQRLWDGNLFNGANNVNGLDVDSNRNNLGEEFFSLDIPEVVSIQKAYIEKMVDSLNGLDNILWEICNEAPHAAFVWQIEMLKHLKAYEARKPKQHLVLLSPGGWQPGGFVFTPEQQFMESQADWIATANGWIDPANPKVYRVEKPVIMDLDHVAPGNHDPSLIWKAFTRGYHFSLYDHPFEDPGSESRAWEIARKNLRQTRLLASRVKDIAGLNPREELASTRYCLADEGKAYIIYAEKQEEFAVSGLQTGRKYLYEWYDALKGTSGEKGNIVPEGTTHRFHPPSKGAALLLMLYNSRSKTAPAESKP